MSIQKLKKYNKTNRYTQYILGDKGYDSINTRQLFIDRGYTTIIDYNKRNTKDPAKIKRLSGEAYKKYKKRIVIENTFCYIKKNRRINLRYDKDISSYISFLYFALCKRIIDRINSKTSS